MPAAPSLKVAIQAAFEKVGEDEANRDRGQREKRPEDFDYAHDFTSSSIHPGV